MLLLPALFFLQTSLLLIYAQGPICLNNAGNYTVNSTYDNNLKAALSSLPTNIGINGFNSTSVGSNDQDRVNTIAVCRSDAQLSDCRGCLQNVTAMLREACPNQRQAVEWGDLCMVRYSNETLLGRLDRLFLVAPIFTEQNASNPMSLGYNLISLLYNLSDIAANGGPIRKVAAGNITGNDIIFALVQCTPDLSADDCGSCLHSAVTKIIDSIPNRRGARVLNPSCILRYQTYPFYNETRLQELDVPAPQLESPAPRNRNMNSTTRTIIIAVVITGAACLTLPFSVYICLKKRMKRKPEEAHEEILEAIDAMTKTESLMYDLNTIRAATKDFSDDNKLGRGGFGAVYRGKLANGQEIAVKRLSMDSGQGVVEFENEVLLLAKLQHRNLVRLLGFCFRKNGKTPHLRIHPTKRLLLDWENRYKIISGIARGILYLHEDSQLRIIHRDLKPSNVLLDGEMKPKIADFGMARLFDQEESEGSTTKIAGTFGYMAPEYMMHGHFSIKSDVFSFGVLIMEIISGKKNNGFRREETAEGLLSFAWKNWHDGTIARMVDPCLRSSFDSLSHMQRCIHIGLLCVQENANDRPTMASVVMMLNSSTLVLATPNKPAFYISGDNVSEASLLEEHISIEYGSSSKRSIPDQWENLSRNDASITDLCPR